MNCSSQIHDELKNMMESTCPFCDQQLVKGKVKSVLGPSGPSGRSLSRFP